MSSIVIECFEEVCFRLYYTKYYTYIRIFIIIDYNMLKLYLIGLCMSHNVFTVMSDKFLHYLLSFSLFVANTSSCHSKCFMFPEMADKQFFIFLIIRDLQYAGTLYILY